MKSIKTPKYTSFWLENKSENQILLLVLVEHWKRQFDIIFFILFEILLFLQFIIVRW